MNSPVLILRDSNWFTDFPTTALWAEYLYAYTHSHSVDGIIAFDQRFLVMLLGELGPLPVQNAPYPLAAENVIEYMRQAKILPEAVTPAGWYRKEFISEIATALLADLTNGEPHDWRGLAEVLSQALAERHLLLQFDDPLIAAWTAKRGWDGAVRPGEAGDFLLVADTNIGFNKTSAVVDVSLAYDVDLSDLSAPVGSLLITHQNNARKDIPCSQWEAPPVVPGEEQYPINRCYWNYLRVYRPAGVELLEATPHAVRSNWMLLGRSVPARVDKVEEELLGVQTFGTLLVVPAGDSLSTSFKFGLPAQVFSMQGDARQRTYHLRVQKQPGTLAIPLTIRIHFANRVTLNTIPSGALVQGQNLLLETDLRTDVEFEVTFTLP